MTDPWDWNSADSMKQKTGNNYSQQDWNSWNTQQQQQQMNQYQSSSNDPHTFNSSPYSSQPQMDNFFTQQQPGFYPNQSLNPQQTPVSVPDSYMNQLSGGVFPQQLLSDPMVNAARVYGEQFAEQQKEKISRYLSTYRLKYYFAVDNAYVGKKIALLMFPFAHKDWSVKFGNSDEPVPARSDVNAPDLYIPLMAFVTYVLVAGFVLGTHGRFSPEKLGLLTSNALAWLIFENIFILISKYVMNISQALSLWHTLAFSSYKFVGMIVSLLVFLAAGMKAYYGAIVYSALAIVFFLIRTVKTFVLEGPGAFSHDGGKKRKLYLLLFISLSQPFVMWWLTSSLTAITPDRLNLAQMAMDGILGSEQAKRFMDNPNLSDQDFETLMANAPLVTPKT